MFFVGVVGQDKMIKKADDSGAEPPNIYTSHPHLICIVHIEQHYVAIVAPPPHPSSTPNPQTSKPPMHADHARHQGTGGTTRGIPQSLYKRSTLPKLHKDPNSEDLRMTPVRNRGSETQKRPGVGESVRSSG